MAISSEDKQPLNRVHTAQSEPELSTKNRSWGNTKDIVLEKELLSSGELSDSSSSSSSVTSSEAPAIPQTRTRRRRCHKRGRGGTKKSRAIAKHELIELSEEEQSKYVAMDCEMVGVGMGGHRSILARVTIVDWHGDIVLDQYAKPTETITDYRTFVSGVTEQDLEHAADVDECRVKVAQVLDGKILIGHHLKNDLKAVGVAHPWFMTRDTAKWELFMKVRFDDGILWPRKLKDLCHEKLGREIQVIGKPHSPIEDATAALDLYKTIRNKWEKAMAYKVNKTRQIMQQQQQ